MNFAFSDEQEAFRTTLRRFLDERSNSEAVREAIESDRGHDPEVWRRMAEDLGLQALAIPEAHGGAGFGFLELVIAFEELGRALAPAPYFSTIALAAGAIVNAGTEAQKAALLPSIADGTTIAALALTEPGGGWDADGIGLGYTRTSAGYVLTGAKALVLDGDRANFFVVAARCPGTKGTEGITLFTVPADAPGVEIAPRKALDLTRGLADVTFKAVPATLLGTVDAGWAPLEKTLRQASVCLAAESVGGAQRCLDMAVEYARIRVQFGRPIGSFQAVKHRAVDMLLEVEGARAAAYYAAWAAHEDNPEFTIVAPLAKACCTDAFLAAAAGNIQIHGGIGYTWEHDAHLLYRRAKANDQLLGDASTHRAKLADALGI
ncbi:MAG: acyl-CoA/acyl-ACP dehydrogenase [Myxococcales bacterium]|nr:acyl-CoA/acyl-ACP dehydrogenase [Myxococcales bacterium]